ncbi:hypothetical protein Unana1_06295 [Umbelopsis nana]
MALKIVGAKISTFTRTIRMALEYLSIPYELQEALPHSDIAYQYNAFGKIPSLVDNDVVLIETLVMRRYIDHVSEGHKTALNPAQFEQQLYVDQWISIASDYAFRELILAISKPRQALEEQGKAEDEIQAQLKDKLERAQVVLRAIDQHLVSGPSSEWLCGSSITWADVFMFPILADFAALPERKLMEQESPHLWKWYERFASTDMASKTFQGTVAEQRK